MASRLEPTSHSLLFVEVEDYPELSHGGWNEVGAEMRRGARNGRAESASGRRGFIARAAMHLKMLNLAARQ